LESEDIETVLSISDEYMMDCIRKKIETYFNMVSSQNRRFDDLLKFADKHGFTRAVNNWVEQYEIKGQFDDKWNYKEIYSYKTNVKFMTKSTINLLNRYVEGIESEMERRNIFLKNYRIEDKKHPIIKYLWSIMEL